MATNSLKSIQYHSTLPPRRRHSIDIPASSSYNNFIKHNQTTPHTLSKTLKLFSISPASTISSSASSTQQLTSLDILKQHLAGRNYREADEETRRLLIALAGESAQKRGYVFFSEVQFIPEKELTDIDQLWREYSEGKFGYSVQKRIWEGKKVKKDFTKFFINVGWMKKLDTEIEQYNYRAFPDEFVWELNDDTPEGHLPLTNALRGTQLLSCILSHPAFENVVDNENVDENGEDGVEIGSKKKGLIDKSSSSNRVFKPDYSF